MLLWIVLIFGWCLSVTDSTCWDITQRYDRESSVNHFISLYERLSVSECGKQEEGRNVVTTINLGDYKSNQPMIINLHLSNSSNQNMKNFIFILRFVGDSPVIVNNSYADSATFNGERFQLKFDRSSERNVKFLGPRIYYWYTESYDANSTYTDVINLSFSSSADINITLDSSCMKTTVYYSPNSCMVESCYEDNIPIGSTHSSPQDIVAIVHFNNPNITKFKLSIIPSGNNYTTPVLILLSFLKILVEIEALDLNQKVILMLQDTVNVVGVLSDNIKLHKLNSMQSLRAKYSQSPHIIEVIRMSESPPAESPSAEILPHVIVDYSKHPLKLASVVHQLAETKCSPDHTYIRVPISSLNQFANLQHYEMHLGELGCKMDFNNKTKSFEKFVNFTNQNCLISSELINISIVTDHSIVKTNVSCESNISMPKIYVYDRKGRARIDYIRPYSQYLMKVENIRNSGLVVNCSFQETDKSGVETLIDFADEHIDKCNYRFIQLFHNTDESDYVVFVNVSEIDAQSIIVQCLLQHKKEITSKSITKCRDRSDPPLFSPVRMLLKKKIYFVDEEVFLSVERIIFLQITFFILGVLFGLLLTKFSKRFCYKVCQSYRKVNRLNSQPPDNDHIALIAFNTSCSETTNGSPPSSHRLASANLTVLQ